MNDKFNLKYVVENTGLTDHVIRIWEKRYQAVVPFRSETNRRFYSKEQIEKLKLLKKATDFGHLVGSIANYSNEELFELVRGLEREKSIKSNGRISESTDLLIKSKKDELINLIKTKDFKEFSKKLIGMQLELSWLQIIEEVIIPVLKVIENGKKENEFDDFCEKFAIFEFSKYLHESKLLSSEHVNQPKLMICTLDGFNSLNSEIVETVAKLSNIPSLSLRIQL